MSADRITELLVQALKQAHAEPGEQRLYRSGKLPGLFATRTGAAAEAAAAAVRDGLLEIVRTETKGKTSVEWVRPTPKSIDFLHTHESPVGVLKELRTTLQASRAGIPAWLERTQQELRELGERLTREAANYQRRLEALSEQVEQALARWESASAPLPNAVADALPWAADAVRYLEHRRVGGVAGACALPELFRALTEQHPELSVPDFHTGLRRLQDRRAVRLVPFTGPSGELPQPEYALLDGGSVLYYATL